MKRIMMAVAISGLFALAGCGGSSGSDAEPFASTADACSAYAAALGNFPQGSPQMTSAGLTQWASQVRVVAEETAGIADRTEDAFLSQLIRKAADGMFKAVETTEAAAQDASEQAITAASEALVEGTQAIRDVTTSCTSGS